MSNIIYCVIHNLDVEMFRERRHYFWTHDSAEVMLNDCINLVKEANKGEKCKTLDELDPDFELFEEEPNVFYGCGNGFAALVEVIVEE